MGLPSTHVSPVKVSLVVYVVPLTCANSLLLSRNKSPSDAEEGKVVPEVIPKLVRAPDLLVAPVPPFPIPSVPVIPGRGDAAKTDAAEVEPRFTSMEGLDVMPVPPLPTFKVPVTPGLGDAAKILTAEVDAKLTCKEGAAVKPVPPEETVKGLPNKVAVGVRDRELSIVLFAVRRK